MIIKIEKSKKQFKRYRVTLDTGKSYDFGLDTGFTYIDGATDEGRSAFRARHYANKIEKKLIDNLIPSPSLFSYYLLWGDSNSLKQNILSLNKLFKTKHNIKFI